MHAGAHLDPSMFLGGLIQANAPLFAGSRSCFSGSGGEVRALADVLRVIHPSLGSTNNLQAIENTLSVIIKGLQMTGNGLRAVANCLFALDHIIYLFVYRSVCFFHLFTNSLRMSSVKTNQERILTSGTMRKRSVGLAKLIQASAGSWE